MKSFLCAFSFGRKLTAQTLKFVKPSERPTPIINPSGPSKIIAETQELADDFKGTKTMEMIDRLINQQIRKGYSMEQILLEVQKGGLISQDLRSAFQNDAKQSEQMQEKVKLVEEQQKKIKSEFPEQYEYYLANQRNSENPIPTQQSKGKEAATHQQQKQDNQKQNPQQQQQQQENKKQSNYQQSKQDQKQQSKQPKQEQQQQSPKTSIKSEPKKKSQDSKDNVKPASIASQKEQAKPNAANSKKDKSEVKQNDNKPNETPKNPSKKPSTGRR